MILKILKFYYKTQLKIMKPYYNWKNERLIAKADQLRQLNDIRIQITQTKLPETDIIDQEILHENDIKVQMLKDTIIEGLVLVIGVFLYLGGIIGHLLFDRQKH